MSRPNCPACGGTRIMGTRHRRPCVHCDDGTMRGVTDLTDEEKEIDGLRRKVAALYCYALAPLSETTAGRMMDLDRIMADPE